MQLLLDLRNNIETDHQKQAADLGLTSTELSFYNILVSELDGEEALDQTKAKQVKDIVQSLVQMLDEASQIVDFFDKWDEQKRVKKDIKRVINANFDDSLVRPVTLRFMELAAVKFKR